MVDKQWTEKEKAKVSVKNGATLANAPRVAQVNRLDQNSPYLNLCCSDCIQQMQSDILDLQIQIAIFPLQENTWHSPQRHNLQLVP